MHRHHGSIAHPELQKNGSEPSAASDNSTVNNGFAEESVKSFTIPRHLSSQIKPIRIAQNISYQVLKVQRKFVY